MRVLNELGGLLEGGWDFFAGQFVPVDDIVGIGDDFAVGFFSVLIAPAKFIAALGCDEDEDVRFL